MQDWVLRMRRVSLSSHSSHAQSCICYRETMAGYRETMAGYRETMAGYREEMTGYRDAHRGSDARGD